MSASDNLSNELFFTAHRGLSHDRVEGSNLGMHWSADKGVAEHFSKNTDRWNDESKPRTMITARIPMSSVETDTFKLMLNNVTDFSGKKYEHEQEIPVRKGAPVFVESISRPGTRAKDLADETYFKYVDNLVEGKNDEAKQLSAKVLQRGEQAKKRNRRITKRFNPPKEMQA